MGPDQRAGATRKPKRAVFLRRNRDELVEEYHQAGLGAEAIVAPHERFAHPQLVATGSVVQVDDPDLGTTTQLGTTIFLEGTPGPGQGTPTPTPGQTTTTCSAQRGSASTTSPRFAKSGVI